MDTAATSSMLDSATYRMLSSGLSRSAVGCEPAARGSSGCFSLIQRATLPLARSSSATCDAFHKLHQALRPLRVATHVYGNDDGIRSLVLRSKLCKMFPVAGSSSTALSDRLFAIRSLSWPSLAINVIPAGYGMAVRGAVFCRPMETVFPAASGCGAIGMNRSGATLPAEKV